MKRLLLFLLLTSCAHAAIVTAASCSVADITTAMTTANTGDTVVIPAGNCTHTSQLNSNTTYTKGIKVQGAGVGRTIINVNYTTPAGNWFDWAPTSGTADFCCMTLGGTVELSSVFINLNGSPSSFRFHHLDITNNSALIIWIGLQGVDSRDANKNVNCTPLLGLIDHNNWVQTQSAGFGKYEGCPTSWTASSQMGVQNGLYVEDNVFTSNVVPWNANIDTLDVECGGYLVVRRNVINNLFQHTHDTGSSGECRATRRVEYYDNTLNCTTAGQCNTAMDMRGATGVMWNNSVQLARYATNMTGTEVFRDSTVGGLPWDFLSGAATHGICDSFRSMCDGSGTPCGGQSTDGVACVAAEGSGICRKSCSTDAICQNAQFPAAKCLLNIDQGGTNGYIVRDQAGAGQDSGALHTQASDPYYFWNNVDSLNANALITSPVTVSAGDVNVLAANRDFYMQGASFTGATGVGRGTLAARPATCTAGSNNAPGVGYWAIDMNTFYRCTATNIWTAYYTPLNRHTQSDPIPARVSTAAF